MHASGCANPKRDELEDDIDTHEMDELDEREGDEIEICGEETHEGGGDEFPYDPPRTLGPLEPSYRAADKVEQQLRERRRNEPSLNIVELARWRR